MENGQKRKEELLASSCKIKPLQSQNMKPGPIVPVHIVLFQTPPPPPPQEKVYMMAFCEGGGKT